MRKDRRGFGAWITRHRKSILVVATLLLIPAYFGMISTGINYEMLSYLPDDLESVQGNEIMAEEFGSAANAMLVIDDYNESDVIKLKKSILDVDSVEEVFWVDDITDMKIPIEILPDSFKDILFQDQSTLLLIKFSEGSSHPKTHEALTDIRELLDETMYLSGTSAILKDTKELADSQTNIYIGLAILLATLVLIASLESSAVPFIILISIGYAVLYNFGTNRLFGEISYITKSLAGVLQLGVTLDYSIFLYHRYEEELRTNEKDEAMAIAIESTASSVIGSSLTTIAGFLAIGAMELGIGKDIGFVMAKGVLFGVISVLTVLPSLILVFDNLIHKFSHKTILPSFEKLSGFVIKHSKGLLITALVLFVPAYYGQANNDVYYNLDESLPKDMESVVALNKLKDEFNMTTTHIALVSKDVDMNHLIEDIEHVTGVVNTINYHKWIGPMIPSEFIPDTVKDTFDTNDYQRILINSEYKAATDEENRQIDDINSILKDYDKNSLLTGEGVLTKDLIEIADHDFKSVNTLSFIAVFLIIAVVFKSVSIPFLLILSIMLAIFINMSLPFYFNKSIPFIAGIVIGSIQLGATVDYAILLTTRFREERQNGHEVNLAMEIALRESARSIVSSGMAFFASTIGVALISEMELVKSLSGMIAKGALISTVIILLILPGILIISEKIISKTTKGWKTNEESI